jgi:hypothetical protein
MTIWWPTVISNEKLWQMTGQININKDIRKHRFGWIGHTLRAKQLCSGIHKVQEEGIGQEIHGDKLH